MSQMLKKPGCRNWIVRVYINGRPKDISTRTSIRREAEIVKARLDLQYRKRHPLADTTTPIVPALESFTAHLQHNRRPKSVLADLSRLRTLFGPRVPALAPRPRGKALTGYTPPLADIPTVEALTPPAILRALDAVCIERGLSNKTRREYREILMRLTRFCAERFSVRFDDPAGPVASVRVPRTNAPEVTFLTHDEIREQLNALTDHPRLRAAVAVMVFAGLRREEVVWLTPADLDLDRQWLTVRAKSDPTTHESWQPKNRRNRGVAVSSALLSEMERYLASDPPAGPWLIPSPTGRRWCPDNFSRVLRAVNADAGLKWSALDYRHTFGSALAKAGLSCSEISTWLGNGEAVARRHYVSTTALTHRRALLDFMDPIDGAPEGPALRLVHPDTDHDTPHTSTGTGA